MKSLASSVIVKSYPRFCTLVRSLSISMSMIDSIVCLDSWSNIITSSTLFRNSGGNVLFRAFCIMPLEYSELMPPTYLSSETLLSNPTPLPKSLSWRVPTFEVIIIIVFLKSTFLPNPSVRRPSSSTCSSRLNTSWCAFSISSNSTME